jgi:hypothetical protein
MLTIALLLDSEIDKMNQIFDRNNLTKIFSYIKMEYLFKINENHSCETKQNKTKQNKTIIIIVY